MAIDKVVIADHSGSMADGMLGLPPEVQEIINKKYGARASLHFNFRTENPVMFVGFDPHNPRHHAMNKILGWYARNLNCQAVTVDVQIPAQMKKGEPRSNMALPIKAETTAALSPYFSMGSDAVVDNTEQNFELHGIDPESGSVAKDKGAFNAVAYEVGNTGNPMENFAIPADTFTNSPEYHGEIKKKVLNRIAQIANMYAEIGVPNYEVGLVFRATKMDGGFGNVFMYQQNDQWVVNVDGTAYQFTNVEVATEFLFHGNNELYPSSEFTGLTTDWEYIMTRRIDVASAKAVGAHFDQQGFHIMPNTAQILDNSSTCVGGGSADIAGEIGDDPMLAGDTRKMINFLFLHDHIHENGHIGVDWLISGQQELDAISHIMQNNELVRKYGNEFAQRVIVECNPRHTLISAVTPALARAARASRGEQSLAVTQEDINALYGIENETTGAGSFAVFDFVDVPEAWVNNDANHTDDHYQVGLGLTDQLIQYVEKFNAKYAGQMVMIPRVDAYYKGDHFVCSIAIAAVPGVTGSSTNQAIFHDYIHQMRQPDGHIRMIDIDKNNEVVDETAQSLEINDPTVEG